MKMLDPFVYEAVWNPKFMRIAECIIGTFQPKLIKPIMTYIINNLKSFIKSRDGYFLLRTIAKNSKISEVQIAFVREISLCFAEFYNCTNGSLLLQSIIHNFALFEYKYIKSCSKHLNNYPESDTKNSLSSRSENNQALADLYQLLTRSARFWDNKNLRPVIECCVKIGGKQFESILLNGLEFHVKELIMSNYGISYFKLMSKYFERTITLKIVSLIIQNLNVIESKPVILKWENFLSELKDDFVKDVTSELNIEERSNLDNLDKARFRPKINNYNYYFLLSVPYLESNINRISVEPNQSASCSCNFAPYESTRQACYNIQSHKLNYMHKSNFQQNYLRHTLLGSQPPIPNTNNLLYPHQLVVTNYQINDARPIPALVHNIRTANPKKIKMSKSKKTQFHK